jgi:serine/threonine protein kinase
MSDDLFNNETELDIGMLSSLIAEAGNQKSSIFEELKQVDLRYLSSTPINQGGIKQIFRSRDAMTGRPVAMAKLRGEVTPDGVEHFLREARIMAHLEHPNIVPVYDVGIDLDGEPFFTMKLLSGENLGDILRKLRKGDPETIDQYGRPELVDIFLKVCDAISYAHSMGIIHLDLKPENIHVSDYGEVLVCDWGLAKIADSDCASEQSLLDDDSLYASCVNFLTMDGTLKGTPGYMAPEQTTAKGVKTVKTDIYSLGAILYSLLTTYCPIEGDDVGEMLENTRKGRIVPPRRRTPERAIPPSLDAVAMKALALNPAVRYDRAEQISQDIHAFRDGYATFAEEAGFVTQLALLTKRYKRESFLIVTALLVVFGLVFFYTVELKTKARETRLALEASELNLKKFKREKKFRENIESAPEYYYQALEEYGNKRYGQAVDLIDFALEYDPYLFRGWELKGHLEFLLGNFSDAADAYAKAESKVADNWKAMALSFNSIPREPGGKLQFSKLLDTLRTINVQYWEPALTTYIIDLMREELNPEEQVQLANIVFKKLSPRPNEKGHFKLQGKAIIANLQKLNHTEGLWLLEGMDIDELNLSGTTLQSMEWSGPYNVRKLNLSGAKQMTSLSGLKLVGLEEVNLSGCATRGINKLRERHLKKLNITKTPGLTEDWFNIICNHMQVDELEMSADVSIDPDVMAALKARTKVILH